ncbi:hypothetical protein BJG92_02288 [Arthrobacter sp. SO5]|nr:hypothetical protein [Arthrobacter sp. SO5]
MKELTVAEHDSAKGLGLQETRDVFGTFVSRTGHTLQEKADRVGSPFPRRQVPNG